jgi:hypothetical protein
VLALLPFVSIRMVFALLPFLSIRAWVDFLFERGSRWQYNQGPRNQEATQNQWHVVFCACPVTIPPALCGVSCDGRSSRHSRQALVVPRASPNNTGTVLLLFRCHQTIPSSAHQGSQLHFNNNNGKRFMISPAQKSYCAA